MDRELKLIEDRLHEPVVKQLIQDTVTLFDMEIAETTKTYRAFSLKYHEDRTKSQGEDIKPILTAFFRLSQDFYTECQNYRHVQSNPDPSSIQEKDRKNAQAFEAAKDPGQGRSDFLNKLSPLFYSLYMKYKPPSMIEIIIDRGFLFHRLPTHLASLKSQQQITPQEIEESYGTKFQNIFKTNLKSSDPQAQKKSQATINACQSLYKAFTDPRMHQGFLQQLYNAIFKNAELLTITPQHYHHFCSLVSPTGIGEKPPIRDTVTILAESKGLTATGSIFSAGPR